jgi:crotonobetainyl-CoA:carnitine CoA-transferase CaiB-like acyl-CoA transferase
MHQCQAAGLPAGAVLNGPGLLDDAHLTARGFFESIERRWQGVKRYPGEPFRMSRAKPVAHTPAPSLGEHTDEVLAALLRLGPDELRDLEAADVTGTIPVAARP